MDTVAEEPSYLLIFGCFSFLVFDIPDKQGFVCLGNDLYLLIRRYAGRVVLNHKKRQYVV